MRATASYSYEADCALMETNIFGQSYHNWKRVLKYWILLNLFESMTQRPFHYKPLELKIIIKLTVFHNNLFICKDNSAVLKIIFVVTLQSIIGWKVTKVNRIQVNSIYYAPNYFYHLLSWTHQYFYFYCLHFSACIV